MDLYVFVPWWAGDEDGGAIYINFNKKPLKEQYKQTIHYINNRKQLMELMHEIKQRTEDMRNAYAEYAKKIIELRKYGHEFLIQLQADYPIFTGIQADLPIVFSDFRKDENGNYEYDIGGDFKVVDAQMIIHIYDCWREAEKLKQAVRHEILHYILFRIGINHSDASAYFHYFCNKYDAHAYKEMGEEKSQLYNKLLLAIPEMQKKYKELGIAEDILGTNYIAMLFAVGSDKENVVNVELYNNGMELMELMEWLSRKRCA